MALDIVLTTGKVPHEIAPIHVIDLVAEEEFQILPKGGLLIQVGYASPLFIAQAVVPERRITGGGVHPGK